ncbi:MAG: hypothetical protein NTY19_40370, partial [Planctomycetota bacterium]|nr:hypothetical protein [Planctomycetota bacterium]
GACLLKRRLEPDSRWPDFVARLGQTKASIQQTSDAHLLAPSLRPKARYMNLASLLKWSRRVLELLGRNASGGVASSRAEVRYGWLREYREAIEEWSRCDATVRRGVEFFRTRGVYVGCQNLPEDLNPKSPTLARPSFRLPSAAPGYPFHQP